MSIRIYYGYGLLWNNALQQPYVVFDRKGQAAVENEGLWAILDALNYTWSEPPVNPLPIPPDGGHLIMCPDGVVQPNLPYVQFAGCNVVSHEDLGVTVITPGGGSAYSIGQLRGTLHLTNSGSVTPTETQPKNISLSLASETLPISEFYKLMNGRHTVIHKINSEIITPISDNDKIMVSTTQQMVITPVSGANMRLQLTATVYLWANGMTGTATVRVTDTAEFYSWEP